MNLTAISAIADALPAQESQPLAFAAAGVSGMPALATSGTPAAGGFGQLVTDGLDKINDQLVSAQVDMQRLAAGDAPDLHRVMINMEQSQLSFQLMMQVRNRLLDAYQDIMKMQV